MLIDKILHVPKMLIKHTFIYPYPIDSLFYLAFTMFFYKHLLHSRFSFFDSHMLLLYLFFILLINPSLSHAYSINFLHELSSQCCFFINLLTHLTILLLLFLPLFLPTIIFFLFQNIYFFLLINLSQMTIYLLFNFCSFLLIRDF